MEQLGLEYLDLVLIHTPGASGDDRYVRLLVNTLRIALYRIVLYHIVSYRIVSYRSSYRTIVSYFVSQRRRPYRVVYVLVTALGIVLGKPVLAAFLLGRTVRANLGAEGFKNDHCP
jgi:hypothetical protein